VRHFLGLILRRHSLETALDNLVRIIANLVDTVNLRISAVVPFDILAGWDTENLGG